MNQTIQWKEITRLFQFQLILAIISFGIIARLALPPLFSHPVNFSPIDAIALFCGAYFHRRWVAFLVVLFTVWLGDIILNKILMGEWVLFYAGFYWQYACYLLIALMGTMFTNKIKPLPIACASLAAATLFFVVSNFGVWVSGLMYPLTLDGFFTCYAAAVPFFKNSVCSDLFFSGVLFGSYEGFKTICPRVFSVI